LYVSTPAIVSLSLPLDHIACCSIVHVDAQAISESLSTAQKLQQSSSTTPIQTAQPALQA
jgi:hypothetical protein